MNNFLLSIGFLLVFALSVLFAGPHFVDWNQYRVNFETQASKIVGREVRVGDEVVLRMLPVPYVRFENVRIADQDGRFADPFLRIKTFTMLLSVPPLLKGDVEASGIELDDPQFHFVIDDAKGPNWKGLGAGDVTLPVMPKNVAFKSVKINNGLVVLKVSGDKKLVQLDKVNVDLSANSMTGPYKLRGSYHNGGKLREVSLATGAQQEDGAIQVKSKIINPENRATYDFDGLLRDGASDPNLDGKLNAILPIFGSGFALPAESRMKRAVGSAAELNASLKGNVREFKLDDLKISFESEGRPQSLGGVAKIDWQDGLSLNSSLRAIWLDLDRIAGAGGKNEFPWIVVRSLLRNLQGNWPSADKIDVSVEMDQATLGGEVINGVLVQLFKSRRELLLKNFSANLPGTGSIQLTGKITEGASPGFAGDVLLRGRSFKRFRQWAMHDWFDMPTMDDGYFTLNGRLDADEQRLKFNRFKGEYGETNFNGDFSYQFDESQLFDISIDSEKIDLHSSTDADLTIKSLIRIWSDYLSTQSRQVASNGGGGAEKWLQYFKNGRLALKISQLLTPNEEFRDVDVDLKLAPELINVSRGQFETGSGAEFKLDGKVNLSADVPKGNLNLIVDAGDLRSVQSVARFIDVPKSMVEIESLSPELAPFRFAGIVKLGTRDGTSTEASLDGSLGDTRATLIARLVGPPGQWKENQVDLVGFLKNDEGAKLLAQLFSSSTEQFSTGDLEGGVAPGRLALRLNGVPDKGMATVFDLEAPGLKSVYRGNLALIDGNVQIEGQASFDAQNARNALKLVRMDRLLVDGGEVTSLSGKGLVVGEAGLFQINDANIRLGNSEYIGGGNLEFTDKGVQVEISAKTGAVALAGVVGLIASGEPDNANSDNPRRPRRRAQKSPQFAWSDKPFDFSVFEHISGSVALAARRFDFGQGYQAYNGLVKLAFGPDVINIEKVTGKFGGGDLTASLDIKRAAAGVAVTGRAVLKQADLREFKRLDEIGGQAVRKSVAQGAVDIEVDVKGRGLSPRGVMAVLEGAGKAEFKDLTLMHFSPEAVEIASNALLVSKNRPRKAELEKAIIGNLSKGVLRVGAKSVGLKIVDGTATLDKQLVKKGGTEVAVTSYVDLNRLLLDSEWVIKPKVKIKGALPPVSLVYSGALKELVSLKPVINAEQLSRELVVRKLELDVAALEALRARDDQLALEAAKAAAEQGGDWGVTETIIEGEGASLQGSDAPGATRKAGVESRGASWQSSVSPVGPYGSAYDPMQDAAPEPAPVRKRKIVRKKRYKKKKKTFNPFFQF